MLTAHIVEITETQCGKTRNSLTWTIFRENSSQGRLLLNTLILRNFFNVMVIDESKFPNFPHGVLDSPTPPLLHLSLQLLRRRLLQAWPLMSVKWKANYWHFLFLHLLLFLFLKSICLIFDWVFANVRSKKRVSNYFLFETSTISKFYVQVDRKRIFSLR